MSMKINVYNQVYAGFTELTLDMQFKKHIRSLVKKTLPLKGLSNTFISVSYLGYSDSRPENRVELFEQGY